MKRRDLVRELVDAGCYLKRHGKRHDIYANPKNGKTAPIPRHAEIKRTLCELIKRQLGVIVATNIIIKQVSNGRASNLGSSKL